MAKIKQSKQSTKYSSKIPLVFKIKDSIYVLKIAIDGRRNCKLVEALENGAHIEAEKLIQALGEEILKSKIDRALNNSKMKRKDDEFRLSY